MYISPQQFINIRTNQWWTSDELFDATSTIHALLKKWWNKLSSDIALEVIAKEDCCVAWLISIYKRLWFLKIKILHRIMWLSNSNESSDESVTIMSSSMSSVSILEKKWHISKQERIWLTISWGWKIYKRSLDKDLDKLVW